MGSDAETNRARVLLSLCRPGVHTQKRLSMRLSAPIGVISLALKQLVKDGYAEHAGLVHDPEVSARRVGAYQITESGRDLAESMEGRR